MTQIVGFVTYSIGIYGNNVDFLYVSRHQSSLDDFLLRFTEMMIALIIYFVIKVLKLKIDPFTVPLSAKCVAYCIFGLISSCRYFSKA